MNMFFIAIVLPGVLDQRVRQFKLYMHERYNCTVALKSPAHITLVPPFWMEAEKETVLRHSLDQLSLRESFTISTENFSAFPPGTIFIALEPNKELEKLKADTDAIFVHRDDLKIKTDSRPFHPHITVATRDLFKRSFFEAWPYFEQRIFQETWVVEGISLLRHNKKNWDVVYTSQFKKI